MKHITKEEFDIIVDERKMFKLSDDMFYGTIDHFADCFFSNVTYEQVVEFADENEVELSAYTDDEHQNWLKRSNI
jgi:hypothetical protein